MSQPIGKSSPAVGGIKRKIRDDQQENKHPAMEEAKRANFSALMATNGTSQPPISTSVNKLPASGGGGSVVKKIVIKAWKEVPKLPENYQDEAWKKLEEAVVAIQQSKSIGSALEDLYQAVENLCTHQFAPLVYAKLKSLVEGHVQSNVGQFLGESTIDPAVFLKAMNDCWQSHCQQMILIRGIFLCLDRKYVLQNAGVMSLWDMGLDTFKVHVIGHQLVQSRTVDGLLLLIDKERQGDTVERSLLKSLLRMLSDLAIYHEAFETKSFYSILFLIRIIELLKLIGI